MTLKTEPAMIMALIQAGISLAISFGLNFTNEQIGGILTVTGLSLGILTREFVTPNAKVNATVAAKVNAQVEEILNTGTGTKTGTGPNPTVNKP